MKRLIQFLTVLFALSMLAVYVAYSQKQHNRSVAPGSRQSGAQVNASSVAPSNAPTPHADLLMPGSKAMVHVVEPDFHSVATQPNWVPPTTSKSGRVFDSSSLP